MLGALARELPHLAIPGADEVPTQLPGIRKASGAILLISGCLCSNSRKLSVLSQFVGGKTLPKPCKSDAVSRRRSFWPRALAGCLPHAIFRTGTTREGRRLIGNHYPRAFPRHICPELVGFSVGSMPDLTVNPRELPVLTGFSEDQPSARVAQFAESFISVIDRRYNTSAQNRTHAGNR